MIFDNKLALRRGVPIGSAISGLLRPVMGRAPYAFNFDNSASPGRRPVVGHRKPPMTWVEEKEL